MKWKRKYSLSFLPPRQQAIACLLVFVFVFFCCCFCFVCFLPNYCQDCHPLLCKAFKETQHSHKNMHWGGHIKTKTSEFILITAYFTYFDLLFLALLSVVVWCSLSVSLVCFLSAPPAEEWNRGGGGGRGLKEKDKQLPYWNQHSGIINCTTEIQDKNPHHGICDFTNITVIHFLP